MNNKVAIITLYDDINIGNKLQNYALQEILKKYFARVETLTYSEAAEITPLIGWKGRLVLKIGFPRHIADEKKAIIDRKKRFCEFSKQYIKTCEAKSFVDYNETINNEYDYFVVGSDQVWHNFSNTIKELDYFFLRFVKKEKRVCFAPSFGFDVIPEQFLTKYTEGLKGFDVLSCREKEGCRLIKELIGEDALLLPDPTLITPLNKWKEIEKKPNYLIPDRFILLYFIGEITPEQRTSICEFSNNMRLDTIDIYSKQSLEHYTTRPDEFLYLISRAEYIFTNSFHCAVFSILFKKRFKIYKRMDLDGMRMDSRFDSLMNDLELKRDKNGFLYPSENTDTIIDSQKKKSTTYLRKVFGKE